MNFDIANPAFLDVYLEKVHHPLEEQGVDFQPYFTSTASNIGYGWWSHDIGGHMMGQRMTSWR